MLFLSEENFSHKKKKILSYIYDNPTMAANFH